jgi:putative selenate reductase
MVELYCAPFVDLVDRMRLEFANQATIFDLPARRWWLPSQQADAPDLSVRFHDRVAGTPVGPASGPQSQMAQNLVLSWLAGSRIMELKTVQINDQLTIGRPCIDAANVGYNIEWSQELRVSDSLDQYVQGAMLIHMLRRAPHVFGRPLGEIDLAGTAGEVIYDMSIGYDLAGIRSDKVRRFIAGMQNAAATVERLRGQLPRRLSAVRDLDYPTALSNSVTLSTFHGCPADEIERICEFLLTEMGVHTIVKMNPPMLGQERLEHLLYDVLGYRELVVNPQAYTSGLQFDQSIPMCRRLVTLAESRGLAFGAKFSNTLEVVNHRDFFPKSEAIMYLSGPPLHVITLALANEFRRAIGPELPISFSAGVDRKNFPNMVACGFVPVTTCTDLLKTGGYGRLPPYLEELAKAMQAVGARNIDEYIANARGQRDAAGGDAQRAGWLNTSIIAAETAADERYTSAKNQMVPRRINSHLVLFDCITCDKCIPVCPNDANFLYETPAVDLEYRDVEVAPDGTIAECGDVRQFTIERKEQIANFADFCNYCGNCDTFCPEWDGPYLMKPNFFGSRASFDAAAPRDGFLLEEASGRFTLDGRIGGQNVRLEQVHIPCSEHDRASRVVLDPGRGGGPPGSLATRNTVDGRARESSADSGRYRYDDGTVAVEITGGSVTGLAADSSRPATRHRLDLGRFHTLVALLAGITNPARVHQVNTRLLAASRPSP